MRLRLLIPPLLVAVFWPSPASWPQVSEEEFFVEDAHPRLLLPARRRRLLKLERERRSMRWVQFETLMRSRTRMPETGFAHALYYVASGEEGHGRQAVQWAMEAGDDLRQVALVFDWCHPLLSREEERVLAGRLQAGIRAARDDGDVATIRSRLLAGIALADHADSVAESQLRFVVQQWWRDRIVPGLKQGRLPISRNETYPLMEILHAVRDNLEIDLRLDHRAYFTSLPVYHLLSYYPAVYPSATNDFRIPIIEDAGEPDLRLAALSRAAELSMVSYDTNAYESQLLQGWLMRDQFLMRGPFGVTYELLWANPYQPGLSYYSAPLVHHDPLRGRLLLRSGWDSDASWFYHERGVMQTFEDGSIKPLDWDSLEDRMVLGNAVVIPLRGSKQFEVDYGEKVTCYLIGLAPDGIYDIEVDDEEIYEDTADAGGILLIEFPPGRTTGVRLRRVN